MTENDSQTILDLRTRLARYTLAVDLLSRMTRTVGEVGVVHDVLDMFEELYAARFVSYTPVVNGEVGEPIIRGERSQGEARDDLLAIPTESLSPMPRGDGFVLRLDHDGGTLGVIGVDRLVFPEQREQYLAIAAETAELLALIIDSARARGSLARISITDEMTGLPNRQICFERLDTELSRTLRAKGSLAVAILDLDNFKQINDEYGHRAGDDILREAAHRMSACIRPYDTLSRIGGEEFLLVAPDVNLDVAARIGERLRRAIADRLFKVDGAMISMTVSCGITVAAATDMSVAALVARADRGLYEAKKTGRDRVIVIPSDENAGHV